MTKQNVAAGTIRAALRYPAFRRLAAGLAVSMIGDWLYNLALIALVYQDTHSPLWAGVATAARVVPIVVLTPFGGVIADRFDRRRVMVACDLIRLALMVVLALVALARLPVVLAPLIAAAATSAAAPYLPCVSAVTPRLVPDADLPGANAARSGISGMAVMVGPALGGILLLLGSPALAFLANAATFGLSALAVLAIPGGDAFRPAGPGERPDGLLRGVADGAAVLRSRPQALRLVGAEFVCTLVYGMQTVLLILVAAQDGLGMHGYGYLFAGIGAGALVGTALASRALRCPHPRAVLLTALAVVALPMPLLAVARWPAVAIALVSLTGTGAILVEVLSETSLQRMLPPDVFGRAFGLALPAILSAIVIGSLIAPFLARVLGSTGALIACGATVAGYALLFLGPEPSGARQPRTGLRLVIRRTATMARPAIVLAAVAGLGLALLTGHGPKPGRLAASQRANQATAAQSPLTLDTYSGQHQRGVFQAINRIVGYGHTVVATGSQTSDGIVRQQFFVSVNGGDSWRLARLRAPGGGQPPVGYPAVRVAGGPAGWVAIGPRAIWTSPNGLCWTLAATHGIAPQLAGDRMWVLTSTARGYLAAGATTAGGTRAVIWTSRDGLTWQRETAARLGLAGPGETVQNISYATSRGSDTVISGTVVKSGTASSGAWLSTDGGSTWTRVMVPVDHGAGSWITGLGSDGSGLIAVRPGHTAGGAGDGVAYFSPNGQAWQYSATIGAAGGWSPNVVKGSGYGFVVTGASAAGQILAYTSAGTGTVWRPTAPLGDAAGETVAGATVGPAGTVIAIGSTAATTVGQRPLFLEANTAGSVRPVSLASIPDGTVPELAVNGLAVADGQQVAVGSVDGYPAIWRKASGSWVLASSLSQVFAEPALRALTGVTHGPAGWLAAGAPGPVVFTSADGLTWHEASGPGSITDVLAGVSTVAAAAGPAGYVIAGTLVAPGGGSAADVWWSPNLTSWTQAHNVNDVSGSSQVLAVAAGPRGFVSVGSHHGRPAVWTTADGRSWTTNVLPVPAGASSAVLQQVAISADRVAALGEETTPAGRVPFAELSVNGGSSWNRVPFRSAGPDTAFTALTADSGGFTAAGQSGGPGRPQSAVWTSVNGSAWARSPASGLAGAWPGGSRQITALSPSGPSNSAVTAIGSIVTEQTQQVFTVTLTADKRA